MEQFLSILALAAVAEVLIETLKPAISPLVPRFIKQPYLYLSALVGLALAFNYNADLIAALLSSLSDSHSAATPAGVAMTGLLLGRGANVVHDLIDRVRG